MSGTTTPAEAGAPGQGRPPGRHRLWNACHHTAVVVGLLCATQRWGWQLTVSGVVAAVFMVVILGLPFTDSGLAAMRRLYSRGLRLAVACVAAAGLVAVGEVPGLVLVLLLVATAPELHRVARARWPGLYASPPPGQGGTEAPPAMRPHARLESTANLAQLSDADLCHAWRSSFVLLESSGPGREHLDVVSRRAAILDELERRCPGGFATWLASGARAPSNPLPYLRDGSPGQGRGSEHQP